MSERPSPVDQDFSPQKDDGACPGLAEHLKYVGNHNQTAHTERKIPSTYIPTPLSPWKRAPQYGQLTALYGVQADKKPPEQPAPKESQSSQY